MADLSGNCAENNNENCDKKFNLDYLYEEDVIISSDKNNKSVIIKFDSLNPLTAGKEETFYTDNSNDKNYLYLENNQYSLKFIYCLKRETGVDGKGSVKNAKDAATRNIYHFKHFKNDNDELLPTGKGSLNIDNPPNGELLLVFEHKNNKVTSKRLLLFLPCNYDNNNTKEKLNLDTIKNELVETTKKSVLYSIHGDTKVICSNFYGKISNTHGFQKKSVTLDSNYKVIIVSPSTLQTFPGGLIMQKWKDDKGNNMKIADRTLDNTNEKMKVTKNRINISTNWEEDMDICTDDKGVIYDNILGGKIEYKINNKTVETNDKEDDLKTFGLMGAMLVGILLIAIIILWFVSRNSTSSSAKKTNKSKPKVVPAGLK